MAYLTSRLVELAVDPIYACDYEGRFIYLNPAAARLLGMNAASLIGSSALRFVHPEFRGAAAALYKGQRAGGVRSTYFRCRIVAADGRTAWIGQHVHVDFVDGRIVAFHVVARNLTALGRPIRPSNQLGAPAGRTMLGRRRGWSPLQFVGPPDTTRFHMAMAGPASGAPASRVVASEPQAVLVVDDDPGVRRFAARVLQRAGYRVLIASTALEAEAVVHQERGHLALVLSDVALADTDGRDLVRRLQAVAPELRTLLMSGYGRVLPGGEFNSTVLAKPFDATGLLHAVAGALV